MNIFYLSIHPHTAAQQLHDKHVVKMILESAQMLSTYYHHTKQDIPLYLQKQLCKPTHQNHPCNKWLRSSEWNVLWLLEHAKELLALYTVIYKKIHKCDHLIHILDRHINVNSYNLNAICCEHTAPPQCMPVEYQSANEELKANRASTSDAYIQYYLHEKLQTWYPSKNKWIANKWTGAFGEDRTPQFVKDFLTTTRLG